MLNKRKTSIKPQRGQKYGIDPSDPSQMICQGYTRCLIIHLLYLSSQWQKTTLKAWVYNSGMMITQQNVDTQSMFNTNALATLGLGTKRNGSVLCMKHYTENLTNPDCEHVPRPTSIALLAKSTGLNTYMSFYSLRVSGMMCDALSRNPLATAPLASSCQVISWSS